MCLDVTITQIENILNIQSSVYYETFTGLSVSGVALCEWLYSATDNENESAEIRDQEQSLNRCLENARIDVNSNTPGDTPPWHHQDLPWDWVNLFRLKIFRNNSHWSLAHRKFQGSLWVVWLSAATLFGRGKHLAAEAVNTF